MRRPREPAGPSLGLALGHRRAAVGGREQPRQEDGVASDLQPQRRGTASRGTEGDPGGWRGTREGGGCSWGSLSGRSHLRAVPCPPPWVACAAWRSCGPWGVCVCVQGWLWLLLMGWVQARVLCGRSTQDKEAGVGGTGRSGPGGGQEPCPPMTVGKAEAACPPRAGGGLACRYRAHPSSAPENLLDAGRFHTCHVSLNPVTLGAECGI